MTRMTPDATTIKTAATGRWVDILTAAGIPAQKLDSKAHPCPRCGGRDRFAAFKDVALRGSVHCRNCFTNGGDGFATVQWLQGIDFPAAVKWVADHLGLSPNCKPGKRRIVAEYNYHDEHRKLLFQVCRFEPKDFRQRRADGNGGWLSNVRGVRVVPYRLPDLLARPFDPVFIPEGEKDCDNLAAIGVLATCNAGGAEKWTAVHSRYLAGRRAVIVPDNDEPGRKHARQVAASLWGIAASIQILELPDLPPKGDVSDWLSNGGTAPKLLELADAAPDWTPTADLDLTPTPGPTAPDGDARKPNEATDDPHRLARLYVDRHGTRDHQQTLWRWRDEWHRWDGTAYRIVPDPEIRAEITRLAKADFDDENKRAINAMEKGKPPTCRKVTCGLANNIMHALSSECLLSGDVVQPAWLDGDGPFPADQVLATTVGLVHLPSLVAGEPCLLQPTPAFFSGNALPYGFDAAADCPVWLRFLRELWADDQASIDTLAEWFGYCLLPDTTQHKLLMLYGPMRSGKGTIGRVLRAVIGTHNLASPTLSSLAGPFGLEPLVGKLVALIADARLSGRTDSIAVVERLLSISGEDPQDVARKHRPTLTGIPLPVRFFVLTNELPRLRDASGALSTRIILLRLTESFLGREDLTLTARLLLELPGILNWSLRGWQRLRERGRFIQPEFGRDLIDDLQDLTSPVKAFADDVCVIGPAYETPLAELFNKWRDWSEEHGHDKAGTHETFAKDLRAVCPRIVKIRRRMRGDFDEKRETMYRGIGLQ